MTEEQFFDDLLRRTEKVFIEKSKTHKTYVNENWNFAICDTPIQKGKGLFFGLNWGGDDINQQSAYPPKDKKRNWNFITHSRAYFKDYFDERIEDLNYSNLCFFRSPNMNHLVSSDWDLGIPLFKEYVDYVKPAWALMMGSPPKQFKSEKYLTNLKSIEIEDKRNKKSVIGYTGTLFNSYYFGCVPHPQAHISSEARKAIWNKVSEQLKLNI